MAKIVTFFLAMFILSSILGSVMQGTGGPQSTALTQSVSATSELITVSSTDGFLEVGWCWIGDEKILYSSTTATTFVVAAGGRGYKDTTAVAHSTGTRVFAQEAGVFNSMAGYDISSIADATGIWAAINLPIAILKLLWNALTINISYLGTDMALLGYFYLAMSIGLIVTIGITLAGGRRI